MNVSNFLILMIEDDPDQVLLTQRALAQAHLVNPLRVVSNGEQAIAYFSGTKPYDDRNSNPLPALVLLDLKLPGMGGLELLEWLRLQPQLKDLPVAVLTVSINPSDRKRAGELGVGAYVCKPVDSEGLLEMMKSIGMYWMILSKSQESGANLEGSALPPKGPSVLILDPDSDFLAALSEGLHRRSPPVLSDLASGIEPAVGLLSRGSYRALVVDGQTFYSEDSRIRGLTRSLGGKMAAFVLGERREGKIRRPSLKSVSPEFFPKRLPLSRLIDDLHGALTGLDPSEAQPNPQPRPEASLAQSGLELPAERSLSRRDTEILGDQVRFQKTSWELVKSAGSSSRMDELIRIYWKPLYFFIRQKGFDNESAKDLVQEFLADALQRKTISKADPARGKFRTFLLSALSNFIKDWHKASNRLKRGGGCDILSLDLTAGERQYAFELASGETPDTILNRAWAQCTLEGCIAELSGNPSHIKAFRMVMNGARYSQIVRETGLSEAAAKAAVCRVRQRLRDAVLRRLRWEGASSEEVQSEIAEFASLL